MNHSLYTTGLSSELCDAFTEYLRLAHPLSESFSWDEAARLLSSFTSVSYHHVTTVLRRAVVRRAATVPKALLYSLLEVLMRTDCAVDAWWNSPGTTIVGLTCAFDQEAGEGSGSRKSFGLMSFTSFQPRPHQPILSVSTSGDRADNPETGVGSGHLSMHSTLNSWGIRGSRCSGSCIAPSSSLHQSRSTTASLTREVVEAVGELSVFVEDDWCSVQFPSEFPSVRFPSEASKESRSNDLPVGLHCRFEDRSKSPSPVFPAENRSRSTTHLSSAVTPTLAELDRYVHRGRASKVCHQFMQTGHCRFGARCLFHHPSTAAVVSVDPLATPRHSHANGPSPFGPYTRAAAHLSERHCPLAALLTGDFVGDASVPSAYHYALPRPSALPTVFGARQMEAVAMEEQREEVRCRSPSPSAFAREVLEALTQSAAYQPVVPLSLPQYTLPRRGLPTHAVQQSTPQQLQVWGRVMSTHLATNSAVSHLSSDKSLADGQ